MEYDARLWPKGLSLKFFDNVKTPEDLAKFFTELSRLADKHQVTMKGISSIISISMIEFENDTARNEFIDELRTLA